MNLPEVAEDLRRAGVLLWRAGNAVPEVAEDLRRAGVLLWRAGNAVHEDEAAERPLDLDALEILALELDDVASRIRKALP